MIYTCWIFCSGGICQGRSDVLWSNHPTQIFFVKNVGSTARADASTGNGFRPPFPVLWLRHKGWMPQYCSVNRTTNYHLSFRLCDWVHHISSILTFFNARFMAFSFPIVTQNHPILNLVARAVILGYIQPTYLRIWSRWSPRFQWLSWLSPLKTDSGGFMGDIPVVCMVFTSLTNEPHQNWWYKNKKKNYSQLLVNDYMSLYVAFMRFISQRSHHCGPWGLGAATLNESNLAKL